MKPQQPFVSVVVVTHDRPTFLARCIESVTRQTWKNSELIVILNPSDDDSEYLAKRWASKVIKTHRNIGAFPALNIGIANAAGELVMLVDDNAEFSSDDALEKMVLFLKSNLSVSAVTCNIRGPCEAEPYGTNQLVSSFKSGFTLYRRNIFSNIAGYFPDLFGRAGAESYLASYIYQSGGSIVVLSDVWMYHAQTIQGRDTRAMNFFAVRSHALVAVLQEPLVIVPASLAAKLASSFVRIALQRGDVVAWTAGWLSFARKLAWAIRARKPISLRTYLYLRNLRRQAGAAGRVVIRHSAEVA
jgi:glycosyltransferase involved in cell wall biosynthesis